MNKNEFYRAVAARTGMTIKDTKTVFETGQEVLFDTLGQGEEVKMFDGVTFERITRAARTARNPQTGELVNVPEKHAPKVRLGKYIKDACA